MDDMLQAAVDIVTAQASARPMTEDEIVSMIKSVANGIGLASSAQTSTENQTESASDIDPKKALKESSITCLECGKSFKIITKKHLAHHGLTSEEYRAKHGYKKKQPLACKSLQRARRKKMKDMRLWERRGKAE